MADVQESLAAAIKREDLAAIARTLDSLPAEIEEQAIPVDEARDLLNDCLEAVITCVTDLDGKPSTDLTPSAVRGRLEQRSRLDDLLAEFHAIVTELGPALFRAHVAQRYSDKRLMRRLIGGAARRLSDTGRDPRGVVHDMIVEELERERAKRKNASVEPRDGEEDEANGNGIGDDP